VTGPGHGGEPPDDVGGWALGKEVWREPAGGGGRKGDDEDVVESWILGDEYRRDGHGLFAVIERLAQRIWTDLGRREGTLPAWWVGAWGLLGLVVAIGIGSVAGGWPAAVVAVVDLGLMLRFGPRLHPRGPRRRWR
jgi:hypothetical protein